MKVLVINAGSATLKYKLVQVANGGTSVLAQGGEELVAGHEAAVRHLLPRLPASPEAIAHRCVHGGDRFGAVAPLTDAVIAELERLTPLDPLHGEATLAGIRATASLELPVMVAFDTAFHQPLPAVAARYAVPTAAPVRRYGFHGWSFRSVMERYSELTGNPAPTLIVLHLGGGASAAAIRAGRSVDTSMGLSPLEGLVMATRPGDTDPGVLLQLLREGHTEASLTELLYRCSGLMALAGDGDLRRLLARDDEAARLAIELFCYRTRKYIGAYLAVLEGQAEAIVFTGGVGEHSSAIRRRIAGPLQWAGVELGEDHDSVQEGCISPVGTRLPVWVIPTREEELIAREVAQHLGGALGRPSATADRGST